VASPDVGLVSPRSMRSVVDFPAPFGPMRPVPVPGSTVKLTSLTACFSPYSLLILSTMSMRYLFAFFPADFSVGFLDHFGRSVMTRLYAIVASVSSIGRPSSSTQACAAKGSVRKPVHHSGDLRWAAANSIAATDLCRQPLPAHLLMTPRSDS